MYYVYVLRSKRITSKIYTGFTIDLISRLRRHNLGFSIYTNKYKPWDVETYVAFSDYSLARDFEKYLKSASGRAFANKRLIKKN